MSHPSQRFTVKRHLYLVPDLPAPSPGPLPGGNVGGWLVVACSELCDGRWIVLALGSEAPLYRVAEVVDGPDGPFVDPLTVDWTDSIGAAALAYAERGGDC